jgi:hypothetical protein
MGQLACVGAASLPQVGLADFPVNSDLSSSPGSAAAAPSLPLARLLGHTAEAVRAVRAGQSLNAALARCPAEARPGTQALSFHALRWLGAAEVLRKGLAEKTPPADVDALLLTALALLWPAGPPPYAEHTLVDQAVAAARARAPRSAGFVNAVLRRFLRERDARVGAAVREPLARFNHPAWWLDRLRLDWPAQWQAIADADNLHPPMTLRVNVRRSSVAAYVRRLAEAGIAGDADSDGAIRLATPVPVLRLPGFAAGDVSVQDAAAQRAAPLLLGAGLRPGHASSMPAQPRAARPRTCSSSPTSTCWRSTETGPGSPASRRRSAGCRCGPRPRSATPPSRPAGGTAVPSTPSSSMHRAPRPASSAATRTCAGCAARPTWRRWLPRRPACSTGCGRC